MAIPTNIETTAKTTLFNAGVEEEIPVPLEKVAAHLGYGCVGFNPDENTMNISGVVDYASKRIFVNLSESLNRQRFTIAHEIGHIVLHSIDAAGIVDLRQNIDAPNDQKEIEANQFAAALLMPRERFMQEWSHTSSTIESLSAMFGASKQAVEIRAKNVLD